jgi:hypothetical protein
VAYTKLQLGPSTPATVRKFINGSVENLYFSDVHAMFRLPLPDQNIGAGQNFAIAQILMAVIGSVSTTLYNQDGETGDLFKRLVEEFFPWDAEPNLEVTRRAAAGIVYDVFRNPLTHSAGLFINWRGNKRYLVHKKYVVKVKRLLDENKTKGHTEEWLENLEASQTRPQMGQTLKVVSHKKVLLVEGLYWGTRRMIEKITTDASKMQKADKFLKSYT